MHETVRGHQHIFARFIDCASAYPRHSCFLSRFSAPTGFPPFFSLVFMVVQAERMVLYILVRHCIPFELNLQDQLVLSHLQPARHPFKFNYFSLTETIMSGTTSTTAFSNSARLDSEQFLQSPDQNKRERLKNSGITLIKVCTPIYFILKLLTYIRPCYPMSSINQ